MPRNELGYGDQRSLADDIFNLIEDEYQDMSLDLQSIVIQLGESWEECRRQVNRLRAMGLVSIDKEEPNWIITVQQ